MKIALQMYTVRDCAQTGDDFIAAMKKVKALGYRGVEFAGYAGLTAEQVKAALDETGLEVVASHEGVDSLDANIDSLLEFSKTIGSKNLVCSWSPAQTKEDMERLQAVLEKAVKKAEPYGIQILYHNHDHEFRLVDGVRPMDQIQDWCGLEVDTYWVFHSKNDPCAYLRDHAAKVGLVHLKDGDLEGHPCAIGEGKNDIAGIMKASEEIGAEWVIVENDDPVPDGMSDVTRSMEALKKLAL